ncbi:MAG: protein serine/threonine phosphatase [Bacteroidetes bacterium]|nr:protein serine/threonine phosphatase [Bacteroidota bacterium]
MAGVYTRLNQLAEAEKCGLQSLAIGRKLGFPSTIMLASKSLSTIYEKKGDWKNAFEMHALYREMSDSVSNDENREAGIKAQLKYDYDKKAAADSINFAKENEIRDLAIAKQESELNTKRYQVYFTIGGLILVIVFAFFIIKRFRITRQQKEIIEHQKKVVEVKQKEILDSIYYAQRIQRSLLTSELYIQRSIDLLKTKRK